MKYKDRFTNKNFKRRTRHIQDRKNNKATRNKSVVKWLGYHDSFTSWVDNKDINKLQSRCPMFTTAWPDFHKFLQVITQFFFINCHYLLFKENNFVITKNYNLFFKLKKKPNLKKQNLLENKKNRNKYYFLKKI